MRRGEFGSSAPASTPSETTSAVEPCSRAVAASLPTVSVQEGGYVLETLGGLVAGFLDAFRS